MLLDNCNIVYLWNQQASGILFCLHLSFFIETLDNKHKNCFVHKKAHLIQSLFFLKLYQGKIFFALCIASFKVDNKFNNSNFVE